MRDGEKKEGEASRGARGGAGSRSASIAREDARVASGIPRDGSGEGVVDARRASGSRRGATSPKWEQMVPPKRRRGNGPKGGGGEGNGQSRGEAGGRTVYADGVLIHAALMAKRVPVRRRPHGRRQQRGAVALPAGRHRPAVYAPRVRSLTAKTIRPFARRSSIADCEREAGAGVSARSARVAGARPDLGPLAARARRRRFAERTFRLRRLVPEFPLFARRDGRATLPLARSTLERVPPPL